MSFFDEVGRKITDVGQGTIQKTKNLADTAKLNSTIAEEQQKIAGVCEQLGRAYIQKYRHDPDPDLAAFVKEVVLSEQKIAECNHSIQEIKGMIPCTRCGAMVDKDSMFCPACGNAMPVREKAVVAPAYCSACGAAIVSGQRFCVSCGARIITCEPAAPQPVPVSGNGQQQEPQPPKDAVSNSNMLNEGE